MATDYTKIVRKLFPAQEDDGPGAVTLRTMTVSAVNSDGTVDLTTSGVTIPSVPKLETIQPMPSGARVQVLASRGQLLVLGPVSTGNPRRAVGSVSITPVASTPTNQTVNYPSLGGSGTITGQVTANSTVPGSSVVETSITSLGATSSLVWIYRTGTTTTTVFWQVERSTQ